MTALKEAARVARHCIVIKDHTVTGVLARPTLRLMDLVGNAPHDVVLTYNYLTAVSISSLLSLRCPRLLAVAFCGVIGTLLPAAFGLLIGIREPTIHDEFSYLLGADTFSHGRLANPAPNLPEFFEAPQIIVTPSYASKYPPAPSLMLAVGSMLFGRPIWGVWISCGLSAAGLCWMLQAWCSRQWALAITVLSIATLGVSTYWAQSYWGGMPAACGGALLFGGLRRTIRSPRVIASTLMGLGVVVLAGTRPYEGVLACLPAGVVLCRWLLLERAQPMRQKLLAFVPFMTVLVIGGGLMGIYHRAVTGDWLRSPYGLTVDQYMPQGVYLFSRARQPERRPVPRLIAFYEEERFPPKVGLNMLAKVSDNLVSRLTMTVTTAFGFGTYEEQGREPYRGVLLWIAFLLPLFGKRSVWVFGLPVFAMLLGEAVVRTYFPLYPTTLGPLVITVWGMIFALTSLNHGWARFIAATVVVAALGQSIVRWWWPHYAAPVVPLVLAGVAMSLPRALASLGGRDRVVRLAPTLILVFAVHLVTLAGLSQLTLDNTLTAESLAPLLQPRAALQHHLAEQGGQHVVFVHYDEDFPLEAEWVFNSADLGEAPVIFVHDLGELKNATLMDAYPRRKAWRVSVSKTNVELVPNSP